jgi:hypothetical protein
MIEKQIDSIWQGFCCLNNFLSISSILNSGGTIRIEDISHSFRGGFIMKLPILFILFIIGMLFMITTGIRVLIKNLPSKKIHSHP